MASDPAFLFYPGDWLGGTMTFTRHQKGAYIDLLMAQFNQFALSIEDIRYILGLDFEVIWEVKLRSKFEVEPDTGLFFNRKLREEMLKRKMFCTSRKNNKSGKNQHSNDRSLVRSHDQRKTSHMENDNACALSSSTPNAFEPQAEDVFKTVLTKAVVFNFEDIWSKYPNKDGKKDALRHFKASVKNEKDMDDIHQALNNYLNSEKVKKGFIKNGSTWFNNWRDWINYEEFVPNGKSKDILEMEELMK